MIRHVTAGGWQDRRRGFPLQSRGHFRPGIGGKRSAFRPPARRGEPVFIPPSNRLPGRDRCCRSQPRGAAAGLRSGSPLGPPPRHRPAVPPPLPATAEIAPWASPPVAGRVAVLIASPAGAPRPDHGRAPSPARLDVDPRDTVPLQLTAHAGHRPPVSLVQYGETDDTPAALVVPLLETGPATESLGASGGDRAPDDAAVECAEGAAAVVPQLEANPSARRGPVAEWIRDSLDDLRASRGSVVPFPQRPAAAANGSRLLDRLRSGERLLARDRGAPGTTGGPPGRKPPPGVGRCRRRS